MANVPSNLLKSVCAQNVLCATFYQHWSIFVIPVVMYGSECWCLRKEDERRNEVTRKELGQQAAKNTGKVQKRQDTKRGYQKGAGTTGHIGRQNQKKKADVVRARNKDGGKQTTGSSAIWTSGGQQQEQNDLEKSCWGLIVGKRLTEEKLEIGMFSLKLRYF